MPLDRRDFLKSLLITPTVGIPLKALSYPNIDSKNADSFDPEYYGLINYHNRFIDHLFPFPERVRKGKFDVIVIGSGMGGGTVANLLSNKGIKTLLIEAGTLLLQSNVANLPVNQELWRQLGVANFDSTIRNTTSDLCTYIGLGGKSAVWNGGVIPRFKKWELQYFGEEITNYLLDKGYQDGEKIMFKNVTRGSFEDDLMKKLTGLLPPQYQMQKLPISNEQPYISYDGDSIKVGNVIQDSAGTYSSLDVLMNSTKAEHKNLFVGMNRLVKVISTQGRRATGVVCHNLITKQEEFYRGEIIILAAGTIESAAIALRSEIHDKSGKIGKGLTDAPTLQFGKFKVSKKGIDGLPVGGKDHARYLLTHSKSDPERYPWNLQLLFNPQYWMIRNAVYAGGTQHAAAEAEAEIFYYLSSNLDERNHLKLQTDKFKPIVTIHENNLMDRFTAEAKNETAKIAELLSLFAKESLKQYKNASTHTAGSLRINTDEQKGVVNEDLRFHQYDNLFACDLSVFPFVSASQPSLTLVSLANRLANHINHIITISKHKEV